MHLPHRSCLRAALAVTCLAPALPAPGDDTGADVALQTMETVVVTATRKQESAIEVAEAVSAVGREDILRTAPQLLAEALRGVPGAFFQQTTPGQGIPIVRGLKGSQVLHLVDGMRLNNAFFRDAPNQYLGLVDAYAAERTEIVRGSAPSLHGADAMGGVVQVLTREPYFDGHEWQTAGRLYGSWNSVDAGLVGRAEAAAGRAGSALSGGVTWQDHGDRRVGGGDTVRPTAYQSEAADIKWTHDFGARAQLLLSAQYLEQPDTPRIDELVPGYGQKAPSSEQYRFLPNRREFLHARFRLDGRSAWYSAFEAHLGRQVITDDRLTQDYGSPAVNREFNESTLDGITLQFNSPWGQTGAADRELIWGFEYYADHISSSRFRSQADSGNSQPVRPRYPDGSTMDSAAVYASNRWHWERFSLEAGLRYSRFEIFLPASAEVGEVRLSPTDLTGDLHLGFELRDGLHLVSNIGRGFRPPNVFDLGTLGPRPGNRFNVPNPGLQPESVWSYDIGLKLSRGDWQVEAFAWYADYRDKIVSRITGEVTPGGRQVVQSDNLNTATLYGFEGGLRYRASAALEYYAVVNYTRGEENGPDGTSVPADRIPPLSGRLGLNWEASDRIRLEPYWDFAAEQDRLSPRDRADPRIDPNGTAGWGTLNLLLSWQASARAQLGLRLQNLGDKNYREHGSGIDAAGRNLGFWLALAF